MKVSLYVREHTSRKYAKATPREAAGAGVDLRTVQDWMGHTDLASTLRYLKPNRTVVQEKVEAIWK
jgi:integrase